VIFTQNSSKEARTQYSKNHWKDSGGWGKGNLKVRNKTLLVLSSCIPLGDENQSQAGADRAEGCGSAPMADLQKLLFNILQIDCVCHKKSLKNSDNHL